MEQMIQLTIDGVKVEVPAGTTVLEAARAANVIIPTLCYLKDINETGNCRICVVDSAARGPGHGGENQHPRDTGSPEGQFGASFEQP